MRISEVAARAGVGVETIRFYERKGIIARPLKPTTGGFRNYPPETVNRVRFVRQAQTLGFSLNEIEELLLLKADPKTDCTDVRMRAQTKLEEVNDKIANLAAIQIALENLIRECRGQKKASNGCPILNALDASNKRPIS
jgi:MerR family transcriptional regulator, copper efflux regulator